MYGDENTTLNRKDQYLATNPPWEMHFSLEDMDSNFEQMFETLKKLQLEPLLSVLLIINKEYLKALFVYLAFFFTCMKPF